MVGDCWNIIKVLAKRSFEIHRDWNEDGGSILILLRLPQKTLLSSFLFWRNKPISETGGRGRPSPSYSSSSSEQKMIPLSQKALWVFPPSPICGQKKRRKSPVTKGKWEPKMMMTSDAPPSRVYKTVFGVTKILISPAPPFFKSPLRTRDWRIRT